MDNQSGVRLQLSFPAWSLVVLVVAEHLGRTTQFSYEQLGALEREALARLRRVRFAGLTGVAAS